MIRNGFTLLETVVLISLFTVLAGVLLPLSRQLIIQGQDTLADTGVSVDRLAHDLRQAAARGWSIDGGDLVLGALRLSNQGAAEQSGASQQQGLLVNDELRLRDGHLQWQRLDNGDVQVELYAPRRAPLIWRIRQDQERPAPGVQP